MEMNNSSLSENDTQDSSSSQELFSIHEDDDAIPFKYTDPLLVTGIMRDVLLNNKEGVLNKISSGKSVRVVDNNGNSLLHLAVQATRDDMSMIDLLLQQEEIDINAVNFRSNTPLMDSISQKNSSVANHLIKAGANVNFPSERTPLNQCLENGSCNICKALIEAGADLNAPDLDGDTPLHLAVYYYQYEMMCMLLYYGAEMRQNALHRPFAFSIAMERFAYADILLDYETEFDSQTLESAMLKKYPNLHKLLMKIGTNEKDFCFAPKQETYCRLIKNTDTFGFIWENFRIQFDFSELFFAIFRYSNDRNFAAIVDILKNSRPELMMELVKWSAMRPFLYPLIMKHANKKVVHELCAIFLSYGIVVWDVDLDVVYENFGYCELFQLLLHMDITVSDFPKYSLVPYLHYSIDYKRSFRDIIQNFRYKGTQTYYEPYKLLTKYNASHTRSNYDLNRQTGVPKLTELARNTLRDNLCVRNNIKNSREFHTLLKMLPYPNYIKKIISLESPIYAISASNEHIEDSKRKRMNRYIRDVMNFYDLEYML